MIASDPQSLKRAAAERALHYVQDGMKLGLGTGTTAEIFLDLLAERVLTGLTIVGVATSQRTAEKARTLNIPIEELNTLGELDLAVDGADECDPHLDLIKGGGGALLREKVVAASAKRLIVVVDDSKFVQRLGGFALPVEVLPFGHMTTARRIRNVAAALDYGAVTPNLRMKEGQPFRTDNGNYIYDVAFGAISEARALATALSQVPGVLGHGLFVDMASVVVVAGAGGVRIRERL